MGVNSKTEVKRGWRTQNGFPRVWRRIWKLSEVRQSKLFGKTPASTQKEARGRGAVPIGNSKKQEIFEFWRVAKSKFLKEKSYNNNSLPRRADHKTMVLST